MILTDKISLDRGTLIYILSCKGTYIVLEVFINYLFTSLLSLFTDWTLIASLSGS